MKNGAPDRQSPITIVGGPFSYTPIPTDSEKNEDPVISGGSFYYTAPLHPSTIDQILQCIISAAEIVCNENFHSTLLWGKEELFSLFTDSKTMLSSIKDNQLQGMISLFTHIAVVRQTEQEVIRLQQQFPGIREDLHGIMDGFFQELFHLRDEVNQQVGILQGDIQRREFQAIQKQKHVRAKVIATDTMTEGRLKLRAMLVRGGDLFPENDETPPLFNLWSDLIHEMERKYEDAVSGAFVSSVLGGKDPLSAKLAAQLLGIVKNMEGREKYAEAFLKCFSMMHKKGDKFLDDVKAEILKEKKSNPEAD